MSLQINLADDVLLNSFIGFSELNSEIILVDENPTSISIVNVSKVGGEVKREQIYKNYQLQSHHMTLAKSDNNTNDKLIKNINKNFIDTISKTEDVETVKYYRKKLFGLISTPQINKIFEISKYFDWILISDKIKGDFSSHKINDKNTIYKLDRVENIDVFVSADLPKEIILLGNKSSISSIFLKQLLSIEKSNIYEVDLQYLIEFSGVRKLILE